MELIQNSREYKKWIEELKSEIQKSQIKAAISVNQTLFILILEDWQVNFRENKHWKMGNSCC